MKTRIINLFLLVLLFFCLGGSAMAQTPAPPLQHFVISGSASGQPASISSVGFQLTSNVSLAYEYIVNPTDSSKPRYGSGVANYTFSAASLVPKSIKAKLLVDLSNYNVTLQAGAGKESLSNATAGGPRVSHIIGNFGAYGSYPMPGGHSQIGLGYKFIVGPQSQVIKVPVGTLTFTF